MPHPRLKAGGGGKKGGKSDPKAGLKAVKKAEKAANASTIVSAEDISISGYMHVSKEEGKSRLRYVDLEERGLYVYVPGGPPDKPRQDNDANQKHFLDLSYYTLAAPAEDLIAFPGFSLHPTYNAPHDLDEYEFVCRNKEEAENWQLHLDAACNNQPFSPPNTAPSIKNMWLVDLRKAELSSFLKVKTDGTAWTSWDLMWVEMEGDKLTLANFMLFKNMKFGGFNNPKPVSEVELNGCTIVAGNPSPIGIEDKMFMVNRPDQPAMYFYAEDRPTMIQWVHVLQQVVGQRELQLGSYRPGVGSQAADPRAAVCEQMRSVSMRCFAYTRQDSKRWAQKFIILQNLQVYIFEPFQPTDRNLTSDDAIRLEEPFAVQEFPAEDCGVSILNGGARYSFVFSNPDECNRLTKLLQVIWHCTRLDGVDPSQLPAMVSVCQHAEAGGDLDPASSSQGLSGMLQWQKAGQPWTLGWLDLDRDALAIHSLAADPMEKVGAVVVTVPLSWSTVTTLNGQNDGLRGFVVDRGPLDRTNVLLHDDARCQLWLDTVENFVQHLTAAVTGNAPGAALSGLSQAATPAAASGVLQAATPAAASGASASAAATVEVDDGDLAELFSLSVPTVDDQLDELSMLDIGAGPPVAQVGQPGQLGASVQPGQLGAGQPVSAMPTPNVGALLAAPVAAPPITILQGILEAKGPGIGKKWQPNFFKLDPFLITCFAHRDDKNKKAEFIITKLNEMQTAADAKEVFTVMNGTDLLQFRAKSEREADMWISSLKKLITGTE